MENSKNKKQQNKENVRDWKVIVTLIAALIAAGVSLYNARQGDILSDKLLRERSMDEFRINQIISQLDMMFSNFTEIRLFTELTRDHKWIIEYHQDPYESRAKFQRLLGNLETNLIRLKAFDIETIDHESVQNSLTKVRDSWMKLSALALEDKEVRDSPPNESIIGGCKVLKTLYGARWCEFVEEVGELQPLLYNIHDNAIEVIEKNLLLSN